MFSNNVLLPLWLQTQMGYTATWAGCVAAPSGLVAVLMTTPVGRLKVDPRWMASASFVAYAAGFFLRSFYTPDASFWTLSLPLFLQGFALSMFFVPLLHILLDGIPPERVPSATGISNFARITSGGFAASLITTFWDRREALHQSRLVESGTSFSPVYRQATGQLRAQGMNPLQAAGAIMRETAKQAYLLSSLDIFYASGWLALAMVLVVWLTRKPAPAKHVAAAD